MQEIHFRLLNGGYYALTIDGEEIGVVYKQEHAMIIETATVNLPKLEQEIEYLKQDREYGQTD